MKNKVISFLVCLFFLTTSLFAQEVSLSEAFPETFAYPLGLEYSHEGSPLLYVVERAGFVKVLNVDEPDQASTVWFDISDKIQASGEIGLLGLAFHPDYPTNETFYVNYNYVNESEQLLTRISRFYAPNGVADKATEEILLSFNQPRSNHNGGQLVFGPDGYLYISLGDGGGSSSRANSQDLSDMMGDILRIDVNTETGYAIPADNPFVNNPDALDEIYSFGLRNPWRMSFDLETGKLWVADVGQSSRESIYIAEKGKNYGWPIVEGTYCFGSSTCDLSDIELPVYEYIYNLDDTGKSITGGYIYRGKENPSLTGKYVYGDFVSGRIWALNIDHETNVVASNTELLETNLKIPSFGVDSNGEIYTLGWGSSAKIYRFAPELTLTTAALKSIDGSNAIQLSWDVNVESGIGSFDIYKGTSINSMEIYDTVAGDVRDFIDESPFDGSSFYAVQAVENDGNKGEMSNLISYYRRSETISDSWQMVSLPFDTAGLSISNTVAYNYDGSYTLTNQLQSGKGYWIRSTAVDGSEYLAEGKGVQSATLQLNSGWNLVGGLVGELPDEFLVDGGEILNSTPMFGFDGSAYQESNSFMPGNGYWLYADSEGEITLDLDSLTVSSPLKNIVSKRNNVHKSTGEYDNIEFESGGQTVNFLVSKNRMSSDVLNTYRLPPIAPNAVLDVRTKKGFRMAVENPVEPEVTASDFPVSVRFESVGDVEASQLPVSLSRGYDVVYKLTLYRNGQYESIELMEKKSFMITDPYDRMELERAEVKNEIVHQTELLPSYPNPFNPTTTVTYRLSEKQQVTISVFDVAGRRIATLIDSEQDAGQYTLPFDASGLASGIYFIRFGAGDVLSTQKLTLIK